MKNRRNLLAAGALALPAVALSARGSTLLGAERKQPCKSLKSGPMADYFPNVEVITHRREKALLYDDLLAGRIVTINFLSTREKGVDKLVDNLVAVQRLLGGRVGRDVFMFTITTDPEHDTPDVLARFAERHGVGPGWSFLTGTPEDMKTLLGSIFVGPHEHGHGLHAGPPCAGGLVRYGNTVTGSFGSFPAMARPAAIAERFTWFGFREGAVRAAS